MRHPTLDRGAIHLYVGACLEVDRLGSEETDRGGDAHYIAMRRLLERNGLLQTADELLAAMRKAEEAQRA